MWLLNTCLFKLYSYRYPQLQIEQQNGSFVIVLLLLTVYCSALNLKYLELESSAAFIIVPLTEPAVHIVITKSLKLEQTSLDDCNASYSTDRVRSCKSRFSLLYNSTTHCDYMSLSLYSIFYIIIHLIIRLS